MRLAALAALAIAAPALAETKADTAPHADEGPGVYIVNLQDGDVVSSPFRVVFGAYGIGVAPALTERENTGHHHLLINETLEGEELEYAIPADDNHLHFGGGQTETVIDLPAGSHTLQLVFGDLNHNLFEPPIWSDVITITVEDAQP